MAGSNDALGDIVINLYVGGGKGLRSNLNEALAMSEDKSNDTHTKAEANYRKPGVKDGNKNCGKCEHYNPQTSQVGRCEIVVGKIQASDICDYYELGVL